MYTYAIMLKALGFITSVFADDDKPEELKNVKKMQRIRRLNYSSVNQEIVLNGKS